MGNRLQIKTEKTGQGKASTQSDSRIQNILENLFVVVLAFYPLRHINWGLDLWDTGYNYANFQYMGTDHMDPMWLFSTYLANVVGHFFSGLPNAGTLWGMNLYTGLLVSLLALTGFFFCTRVLKMPVWVAFLGEFLAVSLCWCPTALLYNYLTYVFVLICLIMLYHGLTKEKKWCLFGAGVCLGLNVLVRFSNLPEAALILAVWAYDVILWRETKKAGIQDRDKAGDLWARLGRHTLWCLLGYLAALTVLFLYIHMRYGFGSYVEGIQRLFSMTDTATDYKPTSMVLGMVMIYVEYLYWVGRIAAIIAAGLLLFVVTGWLEERLSGSKVIRVSNRAFRFGSSVLGVMIGAVTLGWFYRGHLTQLFSRGDAVNGVFSFASFLFYSYDSMLRPGILFLMLTMFIALVRIFHPHCPREEKLVSGMVLLVVLLTSIGSNNGVYPSLNNLFLAGPYTLWQCWNFIRNVGERRIWKIRLSAFPVKCVLTAFLAMCFFQFFLFGAVFVFAEGTGVQNANSYVENVPVLQGVRMSEDKARWMTELGQYIEDEELEGKDIILYGWIPSLSYYLQMPSAFNPWSDLDSYSVEQMALDLEETAEACKRDPEYRPVIIIEREYITYLAGGESALKDLLGLGEEHISKITQDRKWPLLLEFMKQQGYEWDFSNGKFTVFR
ncbi:MAG: hypothetical protein J1E01_03945 [Acetatifactor sp.]|nr:hypothetical protein [Acetatifactor sp.]